MQNFTPKSRHLANVRMQRFVQSHLLSKAGKTLHGSQQSAFQQGLWEPQHTVLGLVCTSAAEAAAVLREPNKEQERMCMCLSQSQGAPMLWPPFHLPPQL